MALSKVKHAKQKARLAARRRDWEVMPNDRKLSNKSGKPSFTKPGSNKK